MLVKKLLSLSPGRFLLVGTIAMVGSSPPLMAQQPIGRTLATEVQVSGAVDISHGETLLGNGSEITAGDQAVKITLQRGGELHLCSTSSVHLAKDRSIDDPASSALMMALDRGAIEANYVVGKYSDVLLTPDLRILISGPGHADLRIRVNTKGDTCVDNHGAEAPYVTVSSQLEGGAYRVLADQRVSFQHGSLREVVDHEPESCGCPVAPVTSVASTGNSGSNPVPPGQHVGGPSSTAADTAFPIAQSEGLAAPPTPRNVPAVPSGQTHAQVTVPLAYNGENPPSGPAEPPSPEPTLNPDAVPAPAATVSPAAAPASAPPVMATSVVPVQPSPSIQEAPQESPQTEVASAPVIPSTKPPPSGGNFFHRIGHFFSRIFG
jgi:hypothetical protein